MDSRKQYTITEDNEHEGEYFGYIMFLTEEEVDLIKSKIESMFEEDEEALWIEPTDYTRGDVEKINKASRNSYMDRLGFYEFQSETTLQDWEEYGDLFYKGNGLNELE